MVKFVYKALKFPPISGGLALVTFIYHSIVSLRSYERYDVSFHSCK